MSVIVDGRTFKLVARDVDDVKLIAYGLLSHEFLGRVVRDTVTVDDIVVLVSAFKLEGVGALEAKGTFLGTGLGRGILE